MGLPFLDSFSAAAGRGVWHADELGLADAQVVATGHAALDAQLPGGGWPVGAMTELLQTAPEAHVWRLLLPALAQAVQAHGGPVVLIGAPYEPCAAALAAQGLPVEALMWVRSDAPAARLWACEQALRCADVAAVLAWLPGVRSTHLRRLQIAAQTHNKLLFVFRTPRAQHESSPAPLRLLIEGATDEAGQLRVLVFKRRGPPLETPLLLDSLPPRLAALLVASRERLRRRREELAPLPLPLNSPDNPLHALLDRIAHLDHH
jgi:protein ImuA